MTQPRVGAAKAFWRIAVVAAAVAAAFASIRDWSARAPQSHPIAALGQFWAGHPKVATDRLVLDSAITSRSGRPLDEDLESQVFAIVRRAPLDAQPFMVGGALAQLKGDTARARRLYRTARLRDPRAPAVRLLLADLELRSGMIEDGLSNLVSIVRVSPGMAAPVVPALAEFAGTPGAVAKMRAALADNPALAGAVMDQLATNPQNAPLLFALQSVSKSPQNGLAPWQQRLVDTTAAAGAVARAREYWGRFNRVRNAPEAPVYNPGFERRAASPPFNWLLASGNAGIAELLPGGGLSIVHFGREPALLARQLLSLGPGTYNLRSDFARRIETRRFEWRVQCLAGTPVQAVPASPEGGTFRAEPNCPAAWLDLYAVPLESGSRADAVLKRVAVRKVG